MGIVFESSKIIKCLHLLENAGIFNVEREEQKKNMYASLPTLIHVPEKSVR